MKISFNSHRQTQSSSTGRHGLALRCIVLHNRTIAVTGRVCRIGSEVSSDINFNQRHHHNAPWSKYNWDFINGVASVISQLFTAILHRNVQFANSRKNKPLYHWDDKIDSIHMDSFVNIGQLILNMLLAKASDVFVRFQIVVQLNLCNQFWDCQIFD